MTPQAQLDDLGAFVLKYWQLLLPLFFGLALSFQAGYFVFPLGLSFYHVSIEDLSKTGLLISLGFSVIYGISPVLTSLKFLETQAAKLLLLALVSLIFVGFDAFNLFQTWDVSAIAARRSATAFLICKILALLMFLGGLTVWHWKERLLGADSLALAYLLTTAFAFSYGVKNFYDDTQSSTQLITSAGKGLVTEGVLIGERTYFYLLLDTNDCNFAVEQKSGASIAKYARLQNNSQQVARINYCLQGTAGVPLKQ